MGVGLTRVAVLLLLLVLWGWSSTARGHVSTTPVAPTVAIAGPATDDGGDWLPALASAPTLPAALLVLAATACIPLLRLPIAVAVRTTRSRAPPAG